jgi:iron complex outermembrane receptor protein
MLVTLGAACAAPVCAQTAEDPLESSAIHEVVVTDTAESQEPEGSEKSGYRNRTGQVGPLGKMELKDVPFSMNVTSGELIENSNAHTVADALKTNPTATLMMSPGGYTSMSRMMVRGFSAADQNEMRDGMVDRSFSWVPIENVERIEIFNGLNGLLTGFGNPGGTVNYVSKKPTDTPLASIRSGVYGGGIAYGHADLGGRVAATGDRVGYRVNLYHEDGSTYIDGSSQERSLISGYFDLRLADETKMWADVSHQTLNATGLQTYITVANWTSMGVPDASKFDASKQYGQDWTYNKAEKTLAGLGLDSQLSDVFSTRIGYRHGFMWRDYALVTDVLQPDTESYKQYYTRSARQYEVTNSGYAMLDAKFETFGIKHQATGGYNATKFYYTRGMDVGGSPGSTGTLLGTSSLSSASVFSDPDLPTGGKLSYATTRQDNLLLGNLITFDEQWSMLMGITHARIGSQGTSWLNGNSNGALVTPTVTRSAQSADTPSFGLMFKPIPSVTTYASYMELLETGGTAPATNNGRAVTNAYQVMAPNISKQYEVGVKSTVAGMDLNTALFRIEKANQYVDPVPNTYVQDGLQVHQGVEFTANGKLTDDLTFVGGFTWLDARVAEAKNAPTTEGKTPVNVPDWVASIYLEQALPFIENLTLTGGSNYYGRRPVNTTNTKYISEVATVDLGLRYKPELEGHPVNINLGVTNLFDTAYWAYFRSNSEGMVLGAPRLVSLSVKATW